MVRLILSTGYARVWSPLIILSPPSLPAVCGGLRDPADCELRNIVSGGPSIIRKPGAYRSNLELTNSLRSIFLAAQQDCAADVVAAAAAAGEGEANGITNGHGGHDDHDDDGTAGAE